MKVKVYELTTELRYIINSLENIGYIFDKIELIKKLQEHYNNSKEWEYCSYYNMLNFFTKDEDGHFLTCEKCFVKLIADGIITIDKYPL
jgi:TPP-dependent 2-oxoacid decarboxylase